MATNSIVVTTKEVLPTFIKKKHELRDLDAALKDASPDAVKYLLSVVNDEKADPRLKVDCSKHLIALRISVNDQISKDQMNRLIAEIKVTPGGGAKSLTVEEDNMKLPSVDFSTVRAI